MAKTMGNAIAQLLGYIGRKWKSFTVGVAMMTAATVIANSYVAGLPLWAAVVFFMGAIVTGISLIVAVLQWSIGFGMPANHQVQTANSAQGHDGMSESHPDDELVQCNTCGYLCKTMAGREDELIFQVSAEHRASGLLGMHIRENGRTATTDPHCFVGGPVDFQRSRDSEFILEEITKQRTCAKWFPRRIGLNPYQHVEEQRTLELEQRRNAFELRLSKMEQDAQDRAARSERRFGRFLAFLAVLAITLALVQVAIALGWIGD